MTGCANKADQKKAILDSVLAIHDKVMGADERLMNNKLKLDTLLKQAALATKDTAILLRAKLVAADSAMDNWMHKFDPDFKGKTDDETLTYLHDQKKAVEALNTQLADAVDQSTKFLLKPKAK